MRAVGRRFSENRLTFNVEANDFYGLMQGQIGKAPSEKQSSEKKKIVFSPLPLNLTFLYLSTHEQLPYWFLDFSE